MKRRELKVEHNKEKYAFALGQVVESLQGAGVVTDAAIRIAREVEKHYLSGRTKTVKLEKLVKRITNIVEEQVGEEVAARFRTQTPPFVPLAVEVGGEDTTFSRRKLANSLEKIGLKLKQAYAVAGEVEQNLRSRGYELVRERELNHLTALTLEAKYGRELRLQFELESNQPSDVQVLEPGGGVVPFSRGILAQSLMAVGLGPELAPAFARQLEDVLWHKGLTRIGHDTLRAEVKALLDKEMGGTVAQRYELMRVTQASSRPLVILIGGAPGVGKSTLTYELAYRLGIRRIVSSDATRQALRSLISPQLSPSLHTSSFGAWRAGLLPGEKGETPKRKRVVRGFQAQVQQLSNALTGIIERSILEADSVIVEGVHLVPGALPLAQRDNAIVLELVLVTPDVETHRANFTRRDEQTGSRRSAERYSQHFVEIRMLHDYIAKRANEEGVATISVDDIEGATDRALSLVLNAVLSATEDAQETTAVIADEDGTDK